MHHDELTAAGLAVAGISLDPPERNREWARRLALPYPLLSDAERAAGAAFRVLRRLGFGPWTVELFRRSTVLADADGVIRVVWEDVRIRGHARQVLDAGRALPAVPAAGPAR